MDEKLQQDPAQRMTDKEAEAVIERFREEEEAMLQEMEARATMPTVKDLAEGLNVPAERVQQLLHKVRQESLEPPPQDTAFTQVEAKQEVNRQNRLALVIAGVIMVCVLIGFFFVMFLGVSEVQISTPQAPAPTTETGGILADDAETVPDVDESSGTAPSAD